MTPRMLVLGASGGFGRAIAHEFAARGWRLRCLARRTPPAGALPADAEFVEADAQDRAVLGLAARDCDAVTHAVGYPYPQWDPAMREVTAKIVATCREIGALLIFPGNVYGFGRRTGRALAEDTPQDATTRKGRLRAELEFMIRRGCDDGRMRALVLRSGDFFGPGLRNGLVDRLFGNAAAGRAMVWPGRLSVPHQWAYLPDLARLTAELVAMRAALAPFQTVHFAGHVFTRQADFLAAIAAGAGRPDLAVRVPPRWLLRLAAPFDPMLGELQELDYLFDDAVILDDPVRRRLAPGFQTTGLAAAIAATLADHAPRTV
jgi:nucleoside-diphosphate-sugar epimerase